MNRYILTMILISALCAGLAFFGLQAGYHELPTAFWLGPPLFFLFTSVLIHFFLMNSVSGRPQRFVNMFIGMLSLKMFLHLIVILAVAFSFKMYAVPFIIVYALNYLLFTVAETISLFRLFYKKSS